MTHAGATSRFEARLRRPLKPGGDTPWAFLVLPADQLVSVLLVVLSVIVAFPLSANAMRPRSVVQHFNLAEVCLLQTEPNRRIAVLRDPAGVKHRVKVGQGIANDFVTLHSVSATGVTLREAVQDTEGDFYQVVHDWKIKRLPIERPRSYDFVTPAERKSVGTLVGAVSAACVGQG